MGIGGGKEGPYQEEGETEERSFFEQLVNKHNH